MKVSGKLLALAVIGCVLATLPTQAESIQPVEPRQKYCSILDGLSKPQADARYIKEKVSVSPVLEKFKDLSASHFKSRSYCGGYREDEGLVAQDIEALFPKAVVNKGASKVISHERLMAYVVQAISELSRRDGGSSNVDLEAVRNELRALSGNINELRSDIADLKATGLTGAERIAELEREQAALKARVVRLEALLGL